MKAPNAIIKAVATVLVASVCGAMPPAAAATAKKQPIKTVVVLVDVSSSIAVEDRKKTYRESFLSAMSAIRPRDRLVIGPIGEKDRSAWLSEFDASSPTSTGMRVTDDRAAAEFKRKATAAFDALMERGEKSPERATRIADSVDAASEAFASDAGNGRVLLILSDMEESGVKTQKDRGAPANLEGAAVHVAGAGGGGRYGEFETNWRKYFAAARVGDLVYGRFPARIAK